MTPTLTAVPEAAVDLFRDKVYEQELSAEELEKLYGSLVEKLESHRYIKGGRLFYLAEAAYYMGRSFQSFEDTGTVTAYFTDLQNGKYLALRKYYSRREQALHYYKRSWNYIDTYIEKYPDSRGYRLYAELLGQMLLLQDIPFLLKEGPNASRYLDKALELDPGNTKARIMKTGEKIYTPRLFGGNPESGIEMLQEISRSHTPDREDRFNIYSGCGFAYAVLDDWEDAAYWFRRALEIYPGNIFARGMVLLCRERLYN